MDQAEQNVLGPDVVVVQQAGFLLGENHDPPRPVGKTLEHGPSVVTVIPGLDAVAIDPRGRASTRYRVGGGRPASLLASNGP